MDRRAMQKEIKLPKLCRLDQQKQTFPLISSHTDNSCQLTIDSHHQVPFPFDSQKENENRLPHLVTQKPNRDTHMRQTCNTIKRGYMNRVSTGLPRTERETTGLNRQYTTIHRLTVGKSKLQGSVLLPYKYTEDDKASHFLSMSKQTADSIVAMMDLLCKQLHSNENYSESVYEESHGNNAEQKELGSQRKRTYKSILKSLPTNSMGREASHHTVTINPDLAETNIYTRDRRGIITDYKFSTEFNDVYSELTE